MNERIKELAKQSCEQVFGGEFGEMKLTMLFAEKFAELIVQECAELFVDQKYMILNPHEPFVNERVRALKDHDKYTVRKIKQHFGVEE